MPPDWLQHVALFHVLLSIGSALLVTADIFLLGRRQPMAIMDAVWPVTLLYFGPAGLIFYGWFGRAPAPRREHHDEEHGHHQGHHHDHRHGDTPMWQATFNGACHCGAGCALGDTLGDWLAFGTGFAVAGSPFAGSLLLSFVLAYALGIVFQFFSVAPMQGLGLRDGLIAAVKADTLSLLAYEVGMFAVMGLRAWLLPGLHPTSWSYWLFMQIAMLGGFATTYPVNWWLVARGFKEKM
ncbi:DUF4396 domain-containing protein [Rhizosaccharibacter radicis]|uniref:DUF4396 domain-containing protein n=1 Tax=Rhizosaccharibacter radicis TaxID=2782605 RepID=A0ABT1VYX5_9PROT|nr:DUF4396 domain-containing protein [Acetobacteraceae bacterium KSS12]